jgi:hypothetical protein
MEVKLLFDLLRGPVKMIDQTQFAGFGLLHTLSRKR